MLTQLTKREWYELYRYDASTYLAIRQGRAVLLEQSADGTLCQTAISEHLSNMACAAWTTNKEFFLFANTSGKCQICDGHTFAVLDTIYLRYEPHSYTFVGLKDQFLFVDRNCRLNCYDCSTKAVTYVSDYKDIIAIRLWNQQLHIFKNDAYRPISKTKTIPKRDTSSLDLPIVVHDVPERLFLGLIHGKCKDRYGKKLVSFEYIPDGQGFREALAVLNPATDTWETLLYISRIESKNCGYFCGCDIDFQRGLLAVIFSRLAVVVDLKTMNILQKQPIQYGSDILWMDDDRLLLATWNGLFLMTLEK